MDHVRLIFGWAVIAEPYRMAHKNVGLRPFSGKHGRGFDAIRSYPVSSATARNLLALLVALAFALQSFFTQTHIHHWPQNLDGPAIVKVTAGDPMGGSAPSDGTPLDCPFCQAIAHTGLFFLPTAPLLHAPVASVQSVALRITRP